MKSEPARRRAALLLAGLLLAAPLPAAKPAPEPPKKTVEVRLMPLGDTPKLVMRYVNGIYTQMPYAPGEAPPGIVQIEDGKTPTAVPLDLNRPTTLPAGVKTDGKLSFVLPAEKGAPAQPWAACALPDRCTKALLLLHPSGRGDWLKPRIIVEDLSPARLGEPGLRLLNHTNLPLEAEVGPVKVALRPGASASVPAARLTGEYVTFRLHRVNDDGTRTPELDRTAPMPRERVDFYVIRPTAPRRGKHIAVCEFSEPLKPAEPAPAKKPAR